MRVKMLVDTGITNGTFVHMGDVLDVDGVTSKRWFHHGIAEAVTSETSEVESSSVSEVPASTSDDIQPSAVSEKKKTAKQHKDK